MYLILNVSRMSSPRHVCGVYVMTLSADLIPLSPQFFCVPIEEPHMYVCIHIYVQAEETVAIPARNLTKRIVHGFFEADNSAAAPQRAYGTIVSWPGPKLK